MSTENYGMRECCKCKSENVYYYFENPSRPHAVIECLDCGIKLEMTDGEKDVVIQKYLLEKWNDRK